MIVAPKKDGQKWQVYASRKGEKVYAGSFSTWEEAHEEDEDRKHQNKKRKQGKLPAEHDPRRTVHDAIFGGFDLSDAELIAAEAKLPTEKKRQEFRDNIGFLATKRALPIEEVGARSWEEYEVRFRNHLPESFLDLPICDVTTRRIKELRETLKAKRTEGAAQTSRNGKRLSPTTVNGVISALSSLFTLAIEREWISEHPLLGKKLKKLPTKDRAVTKGQWIQDPADIAKLLSECQGDLRDIVFMAVNTGARINEILHCQWDDLDLKRGELTIQRGRNGITKSGKARTISLAPGVVAHLKEMKLAAAKGEQLIFPGTVKNENGTYKARNKSAVYISFKRALKRAGLSPRLTLHSLRHTHASLWVSANHSIYSISQRLGHASVGITQDVYAHLRTGHDAEAVAATAIPMPADKPTGKLLSMVQA